jgi:H+/Cl- antiporter ClcA
MPPVNRGRPASLVALLVTALVTGAFVGFVAAAFIWLIEEGTTLVWRELPEAIGVDPFESWWIIAVPIVGGLLVGAGQIVLGNYPRPLEEAIASWKEGGHIEPQVAPKTAVNSHRRCRRPGDRQIARVSPDAAGTALLPADGSGRSPDVTPA